MGLSGFEFVGEFELRRGAELRIQSMQGLNLVLD